MRIAVITCYKQPDYVRAQTLRAAVGLHPDHELLVIKNTHTGLMRYAEVLGKVIAARIRHKPDLYLVTFRGYEILPVMNILTWPKPLIFDEFINPLEWLLEPRPEPWAKLVPKGLLRGVYKLLLRRPALILADTVPHALHSALVTYGAGQAGRFAALPVSTDEATFRPVKRIKTKRFRVFYYGNMLPLHGLQHVLEAAVLLKEKPVEFMIVGGKLPTRIAVEEAVEQGAHIEYKEWADYENLPREIAQADLCLGGPFGDTNQAEHVVTGKTYQFLACGAPTLIGRTLASSGFSDRVDCLMVPLGDGTALAAAIEWAQKHPEELTRIGRQGRVLYEERFSNAILSHQLGTLLERL